MHINTRTLQIPVGVFHLSRTIYYEWLRRFNKLGYLGLQDKKKAKPKMPNQIKPDKEKIILNYIIEYPTHGPRRIANELRQQGNTVSETGVYNVLCRKQLNHRLDRLFYAQEHSDNPIITEWVPSRAWDASTSRPALMPTVTSAWPRSIGTRRQKAPLIL